MKRKGGKKPGGAPRMKFKGGGTKVRTRAPQASQFKRQPLCPTSGKIIFKRKWMADSARGGMKVYKCEGCGNWHLTNQ